MYWGTLHSLQWRVYAEHIALDEKEELERRRDFAEYIMAFHNYEAVASVQNSRLEEEYEEENPTSEEEVSHDDAFTKQLQEMGIDLDTKKINQARNRAHQEEEEYLRSAPSSRNGVQDRMRVHLKDR